MQNEYGGTGFPKSVFVHRKEMGNEAEGSHTVGSLEPFLGRALDGMGASGMDNLGVRRFLFTRAREKKVRRLFLQKSVLWRRDDGMRSAESSGADGQRSAEVESGEGDRDALRWSTAVCHCQASEQSRALQEA